MTITAKNQVELLTKLTTLKVSKPAKGFDFIKKNGKWSVTIN